MNYHAIAYCFYLGIILPVILVVGHLLFSSGRAFIFKCLHGDVHLADALNKILLAGYYLVNAGYAVLMLKINARLDNFIQLTDVLSKKIGTIVLLLGILHLFNLTMLLVSDRRRTNKELHHAEHTHQR